MASIEIWWKMPALIVLVGRLKRPEESKSGKNWVIMPVLVHFTLLFYS
jgi:hypothetical protein